MRIPSKAEGCFFSKNIIILLYLIYIRLVRRRNDSGERIRAGASLSSPPPPSSGKAMPGDAHRGEGEGAGTCPRASDHPRPPPPEGDIRGEGNGARKKAADGYSASPAATGRSSPERRRSDGPRGTRFLPKIGLRIVPITTQMIEMTTNGRSQPAIIQRNSAPVRK